MWARCHVAPGSSVLAESTSRTRSHEETSHELVDQDPSCPAQAGDGCLHPQLRRRSPEGRRGDGGPVAGHGGRHLPVPAQGRSRAVHQGVGRRRVGGRWAAARPDGPDRVGGPRRHRNRAVHRRRPRGEAPRSIGKRVSPTGRTPMFDDPDYRPRTARPHRAPTAGRELTNRWPVYGDPVRLAEAAALLRTGDAEQIFGTRYPGEYVMTGVARLLEAVAARIRERVDLGHEVVSAATEIAEHALDFLPRDGKPG